MKHLIKNRKVEEKEMARPIGMDVCSGFTNSLSVENIYIFLLIGATSRNEREIEHQD
jgi:hypothetical protein